MEQSYEGNDENIRQVLRPLILSMKMFGLYFDNQEGENTSRRTPNGKIYSVLIVVILWLNTLRVIPALFIVRDKQPNYMVDQMPLLLWALLGTINATILFYGCRKHIPQINQKLHTLIRSAAQTDLHVDRFTENKVTRKRVLVLTTIAWLALLICILSTFIIMFCSSPRIRDRYATIISSPAPSTPLFSCLFMVPITYSAAAWLFPLVYQITIGTCIGQELDMIAEGLDVEVKQSSRGHAVNIDRLRKRHIQICKIVDSVDKLSSLWIMNAFMTNIPMNCFIVYSWIRGTGDVISVGTQSFYLLGGFVYVCCVSIVSSRVNMKAHSPLDHIYAINLSGTTPDQLGQLQLFLSKLNGPSIGFTAMRLITVTKEVILTLAGLFLTYFFLLLQFKI